MTTIRIPDFVGLIARFRSGFNPDYEEALQTAEEWFAKYNVISPNMLKNFINSGIAVAGAFIYPLADKNSLTLAIELYFLIYAYDNPFDEDLLMLDESTATRFTSTFVSAIRDTESFHPVPNIPIILAFRDFLGRLRANTTAGGYKRSVDQIVEYVMAVEKQIGMRVHHIYPTATEYLPHRRAAGSVKVFYTLVEIICRIDFPDSIIEHTTIQEILDVSNDIVVWTNDIVSFNKEQAQGDYFNFVSILCIEKKIPVQLAIDYVFLKLESAVGRWFDLRAQIPKFDSRTDEIVSKYVEGLEYSVSGFVHWHYEIDRFLGPKECRSEVKNTLVKVLPLEPGFPQLSSDIKYNVVEF